MEEASSRSSLEARVVFFAILVMVLGVGGLVYWQAQEAAPPTAAMVEWAFDPAVLELLGERLEASEEAGVKLRLDLDALRVEFEKSQAASRLLEGRCREMLDEMKLNTAGAGDELKTGIASLMETQIDMQSEIKKLAIRNDSLEIQIEDVHDAAELAGELVADGKPGTTDAVLTEARDPNEVDSRLLTNVRVIDSNEGLEYVVLDVGGADGVRPQMLFRVLDRGKVTASLRAIDVRPNLTGAVVENLTGRTFPRTGDRVVLGSTRN